ncbi:hypothetical protein BZM27_09050 [Paraburkholderia steynii]|uniref:Uncharacterized protein n=1 Tax=Paraburkholderia steynii TaxID=1245441 RepID=A0A4R0XN17_9BURK|nr:hypothetical protein BZM27_09050 [Paraburkholderia steynii]
MRTNARPFLPTRQKLPLSQRRELLLCSTSLNSLSASDVPLFGRRFTSAMRGMSTRDVRAARVGNGACSNT